MTNARREGKSGEWADLDMQAIESMTARAKRVGWRAAVAEAGHKAPFFVQRMNDLSLGDWHLLLTKPRSCIAVDVGCGFGSLLIGLASYYHSAIGIEYLPERLQFANLRASQDAIKAAQFARGSALALPLKNSCVDLVTVNGVLEWAGLYADAEDVEKTQNLLLQEASRVLRGSGSLCVAIENRFALETLMLMPDTHTGMHLLPAIPKKIAQKAHQIVKGKPNRTQLYSRRGYDRIIRAAGFRSARVLDLAPSYNNYDFLIQPSDMATYALLHHHGLVRSFYGPARGVRKAFASVAPYLLGEIAYAFLIIAGDSVLTALDASHPIWKIAQQLGVTPSRSQFACRIEPGSLLIITHNGSEIHGAVEIATFSRSSGVLPAARHKINSLTERLDQVGGGKYGDLFLRIYRTG